VDADGALTLGINFYVDTTLVTYADGLNRLTGMMMQRYSLLRRWLWCVAVVRADGVCAVHISIMNHRASVLASPDSRTQIGFIQDIRIRDGESENWFQIGRDILYQRQLAFLRSLLEPYAGGVPMRSGPPFCAPGAAPLVLLVPRVGVVLCDIVERRAICGTTSNSCTSCGAAVMVPATKGRVSDDENAKLVESLIGKVSHMASRRDVTAPVRVLQLCAVTGMLPNVLLLRQWWTPFAQQQRHRDPGVRHTLLAKPEYALPSRVGAAMPSLTTIAVKTIADKYRERGCTPFVEPALELPADPACAAWVVLAGVPLAQRTPLDYLHMVRPPTLVQPECLLHSAVFVVLTV
jgi:hypothetical protein